MEILAKLFDSKERVQIMRFFLFNQDFIYSVSDLFLKTGASKKDIDRELDNLEKAGLIRRKPFIKGQKDLEGGILKGRGWVLNKNFRYVRSLENLLINQGLISEQELLRRVSSWGKIKFILIAGIFTQDSESRVDLMVVADNIRQGSVNRTISNFEKEVGCEIKYSVFETSEFKYRLGMNDKLVHDIIDYPHKTLVNRLNWPGLE
jgi:hypothetical protein